MSDALADLWQHSQAAITGRMTVLEQAAAALQDGALDAELRGQAAREAHKLAGLLGIFGRDEGSRLALDIERLLGGEARLGRPEAARIAALLADLRRAIDRAPGAPTADPEAKIGGAAERVEHSRREQAVTSGSVGAEAGSPGNAEDALGPTVGSQAVRRPSRASLLLVDDDDTVAKVVETALGRAGYQVVRARNATEALHLATKQPFGLILLDVQMPEMDGHAACRSLRAVPALAHVPIIMLSAQSDAGTVVSGFAHGATDFLAKPFAISQLRARVEMWLLRAASRREEPGA